MQGSREVVIKKQRLQLRGCKALCCSCRLSVSSPEESESSNSDTISSLAHAMVQEKLNQIIRERRGEAKNEDRSRARGGGDGTKFVVMVATEKSSYDPRKDFRESLMEMITTNQIHEPKDLRSLLNYYVTMNSEEYRGVVLEVFYEVCTGMFLKCKYHR